MKFKGLYRKEYSDTWDEALPIGNGTIGGLVHANPFNEVIETNHEELFLPMPFNNDSRPFKGAHLLPELRKLILEGKYLEATKFWEKGLSKDGYPEGEIIWTNPYEVATNIHIDLKQDNKGEIEDYFQKLDFRTGEALVYVKAKDLSVERKSFVSRTRNVMPVEISSLNGKSFDLQVYFSENPQIHDLESVNDYAEEDFLISEVTHAEETGGYVSCLKVISDGIKTYRDNGFYIYGAKKVLLLYGISPWKNRLRAKKVTLLRELSVLKGDYEELLKESAACHRELFERVLVEFSKEEKELTNEEIRALCTEDTLAPEFLERMVDFGRYLLISSFGKLPPNLQGIWNGNANPPWCSDYTLDENIQMMMWSVLPGNLQEFSRVYFDWLESYSEDFRKNAMSYYGCRGIFAAARVSTDGFHRHFGLNWPMFFWTAGAGWLSQVYEDFYEYTLDENILLRGLKYWKEVVLFYEDFLIEDEEGKYLFVPSYSPENTPLGNDSPTAVNATMDVAVAKEVYKNLIRAAKILNVEKENLPKWEKELEKFPDYSVNEDGALKEWIPKNFKDDYHHRHSSHLYMVFPGHEALEEGNDELLMWCHKASEYRLLDGVDAISGWGLAHLANISARLKDSRLWYLALNRLIQKFTLDNFFTGHNEHELFQMDANLGITASVYESFLYSDMDKIELFPVISDKFNFAEIKGLRTRGAVRVISLKRSLDSFEGRFENQGKNDMRIVCPEGFSFENGDRELVLKAGGQITVRGFLRK